jgi:hypothetical protein
MAGIGDEEEFLFECRHRDQVRRVDRQRQQSEVPRARAQHRNRSLAAADGDLQIQVRMNAAHLGEQFREDVEAHRHAAHQPHRCAQRLLLFGDSGYGVLQVLEHAVAQPQQRFAGRRDANLPPDAMEHRFAEFVFEQQDLAADGGLRDVELVACRRERARVSDGADDFELPQVHGC